MNVTYIRITILDYFLTATLNWQVLLGKEKYLLNSLHEKLKNKVSLKKNVHSKECLFHGKTNKCQICSSKFLNSIQL